jgi:uncharacterized membrane protein YdbT with pleckstrin-like domain
VAFKASPDEELIYQGHPSWRAIIGFYLKGILIVVVLAVIAKVADSTSTASIVLVAGLAVIVLLGFIKRIVTTYTITNRRLHISRGIIARKVQETQLDRVQNVNYTQGVYERLVRIGNVDFDTAASGDYDFVFAGVADPEQVVQDVDKATRGRAAHSAGLGKTESSA